MLLIEDVFYNARISCYVLPVHRLTRTPSPDGRTDLNYPHPPPSSTSLYRLLASCLPSISPSPPSSLHLSRPSLPSLPVFRHQHSALQQQQASQPASQPDGRTGGLFKSRRSGVALVPPLLSLPPLPIHPSLLCMRICSQGRNGHRVVGWDSRRLSSSHTCDSD